MRVFISMRFLTLFLISTCVLALQIEQISQGESDLLVSLEIKASTYETVFTVGDRHLNLPAVPDADWTYFPGRNTLRPLITIPIVLPPDGRLPTLQVLDQTVTQLSFEFPEFSPQEAELSGVSRADGSLDPNAAAQVVRTGRSGQRWFGAVLIQPLTLEGQQITALSLRLDFGQTPQLQVDSGPVKIPALNAEMAKGWTIPRGKKLSRRVDNPPEGSWYKIPIRENGVYAITRTSLSGSLPQIAPEKWRLFAPYSQGRTLPQNLEVDGVIPPNLIEISYQGMGLGDGELNEGDQLRFFARGPNGDLHGDHVTNPYFNEVYYWLLIPSDPNAEGKSIPTLTSLDGDTDTIINTYKEVFYHEKEQKNPLRSGLTWFGEQFVGTSTTLTLKFDAWDPVTTGDLTVSARFYPSLESSLGSDNHSVSILANQTTLRQYNTTGTMPFNVFGTANAGVLNQGENQIRLHYQSNRSQSEIYLDSLRLSYERPLAPKSGEIVMAHLHLDAGLNRVVFTNLNSNDHFWDVSDPAAPAQLTIQANQFQLNGPGALHLLGFSDDDVRTATTIEVSDFTYQLRRPEIDGEYIVIAPKIFSQEAERIKDLRENRVLPEDRMTVKIAYIEDIYREFAAGAQDPIAIRNFISYAYWNWQTQPGYVFILGDADYDYRNYTGQSKILVPVWETDGTSSGNLSDIATRATDDFYVYVVGGPGDRAPDLAIGRLPARDLTSLTIMVDKIDAYQTNPVPGVWRNTAILVGDDPLRPSVGETMHIGQCEDLYNRLPASFITKKIYLTEYPDVQDPTSAYVRKPDAREDLLQKIYDGAAIITYMGHGSPTVWAQERVFTQSDLPRLDTGMKLPFWVAGTCDWGYFDDVNSNCVPETILNMRDEGGVGILTATRKVGSFSNATLMKSVYEGLFQYGDRSTSNTLGDAVRLGKSSSFNTMNDEKYVLFTDPALKLVSPRDKGVMEQVTPSQPRALGKLAFSGDVQSDAPLDGQAVVTAYDSKRNVTRHYSGYVPNSSQGYYEGDISYILPGQRIFRGLISVTSGAFSGEFTIPKDIRYVGRSGILNVQYWDTQGHSGVAFVDTLSFTGSDSTSTDETGPDIQFYYFGQPLMNGYQVLGSDNLTIEIYDENGINLTGVAGHGISLAIDEDWVNAVDVTELYEYDVDRTDLGRLDVLLANMEEGTHTVSVKAWDNFNNPNVSTISLNFTSSTEFQIVDIYNYPNPMTSETIFWFRLTDAADVKIKIFSLGGRMVRTISLGSVGKGYHMGHWDGRDEFGQLLANGVYLYVVEAKYDLAADPRQAIQKLVISR
ncbi:MAG: type IX secretion system sortase PorU [Candidatus Marinimicrobia bacterium]|nr:type IX secretion system sortase PorU [Candidatus Neomarinimicrobiota bacterium]MCF7902118.1 type IX secretion system sortase PorU [Candidatus Neomarinimicrobiota bacterium]